MPTSNFKVNDKVAYSVRFLESIQMQHSEAAHERGVIMEIRETTGPDIAQVQWESGPLMLLRTGYLAHVGPNMEFCKC